MIRVQDNLFQWDTDVQVEIGRDSEVHFAAVGATQALVVDSQERDGRFYAPLPNILLQEARDIFIYVMDGESTVDSKRVSVIARPKPEDYVYTETEVKTYDELLDEIQELAARLDSLALPIASSSTLGGIKVGQNLEVSEDGTLDAPYSAKGDKGDKGDKGETGEPGYTPQRGVDYWTESDIAEIEAYIDEQLGVIENGAY